MAPTPMQAVILAGGEGTRLRPLTLERPKPIVPVVDRPFLSYQLDLLATAGVRDVIFSVAYQPDRIQAVFGDGTDTGRHIRYAVEASPLGTGGAVKNAAPWLAETVVVLNGDVLTDVDLPAVLELHRSSQAAATIVLTPVPNPAAYGLVETQADGRVLRFIEKPGPNEITTDTINAGIYVLETRTLDLMPAGEKHSIERAFFPTLLGRGDLVMAYVHRGYWIDIGTPEKYLQVHRDILAGRFRVALAGAPRDGGWVHAGACVEDGAELAGPFYVGPGCRVAARARIGPETVLVADVEVGDGARVRGSVVWPGCRIGPQARVEGALLAARVELGGHASLGPGAVIGDAARLPDYSRAG